MKFKTTIKHQAGTVIDVAGEQFALDVDADGYAVIDTDNEAAIERLLAIPEGFAVIDGVPAAVGAQASFVITNGEGESLDLGALDDEALRAFAAEQGIKVHHKAKGDTLRTAIVKALAGE